MVNDNNKFWNAKPNSWISWDSNVSIALFWFVCMSVCGGRRGGHVFFLVFFFCRPLYRGGWGGGGGGGGGGWGGGPITAM